MIKTFKTTIVLVAIFSLLSACSQARNTQTNDVQTSVKSIEKGKASYYADKYQGRQTASGERFNQNAQTAAHNTLAFGTRVRVTNLRNGRSVIVRINDRGPFVRGRIIDLSKSAFTAIAEKRLGVVDVIMEVLR